MLAYFIFVMMRYIGSNIISMADTHVSLSLSCHATVLRYKIMLDLWKRCLQHLQTLGVRYSRTMEWMPAEASLSTAARWNRWIYTRALRLASPFRFRREIVTFVHNRRVASIIRSYTFRIRILNLDEISFAFAASWNAMQHGWLSG